MKNVLIMGAAGKDFHIFNMLYKNNPNAKVVCFTATQIPGIEERSFPKQLAGANYDADIPIYPESKLAQLIREHNIDEVVFAYSDVSNQYVMEKAALVNAAGADFKLVGLEEMMLKSDKPCIAVTAVRTGCGKSQTSRKIALLLRDRFNKKVAVIRHPMPYGDLVKQEVQKFSGYEDLDAAECTIEEREEYEPYIENGITVYAGVNYEKILREAEKDADIIIWDGGNNDMPFVKPDLYFVVADPLRENHEILYYPGIVNFCAADYIIINKENSAKEESIKTIEQNAKIFNPNAKIIHADSVLALNQDPKEKRVICVEDGPSITHGEMPYGAATVKAKELGLEIINAKEFAVGTIKETYQKYKHLSYALPAMGYSKQQIADLKETIEKSNAEAVIYATPINLERLLKLSIPCYRVKYELKEKNIALEEVLKNFLDKVF